MIIYRAVTTILNLESGGRFPSQFGLVTPAEWVYREKSRLEKLGMFAKIEAEGDGHTLMAAFPEEPAEREHPAVLPEQLYSGKVVFRCIRCGSLYDHRIRWCSGTTKDIKKDRLVPCCKGSMDEAELGVVKISNNGKTEF